MCASADKMYNQYTIGAIFIIFILCVHCDNAVNNNEVKEIYVPSAPQNLVTYLVTSNEILLSWAPPLTYTVALYSSPEKEPTTTTAPPKKQEPQSDEPINDVIEEPSDSIAPEKLKEDYSSYWINDKKNLNDEYPPDLDSYRSKREVRSHRHRKRRQDANNTEAKHLENEEYMETHSVYNYPIEVVKKSGTKQLKDTTQYAYVLYYEQGVARFDTVNVSGVQTSDQVKRQNVFSSDLGMEGYSRSTKNLTLLNTSGKVTKVVGFRLKNLKPFTPYKIWVRAFFNTEGVLSSDLHSRLSNKSEPLYVLTDVVPPSAPNILDIKCDLDKRNLYLQWRQPAEYNNSLDQYVVTVRKIPDLQPRTRLTLPTNKNDIETTISVEVDTWNNTSYEVKMYAATKSVARAHTVINGSESPPKEVSSEWCSTHSEAMSPPSEQGARSGGVSTAALLAVALIPILAALLLALVYWRSRLSKCISAAYNYLEEGGERAARAPLNAYKKPVAACSPVRAASSGAGSEAEAVSSPAPPPRMASPHHPAVPAAAFPRHVAALHADGDIGFSKEYEIVVTKSAALGHTSHHSHRPENRQKNRYLNITAYDHSRVCVSAGGRCGAAGCAGAGGAGGARCDYVNANFIDGMRPRLTRRALARLRRKLDRRARPHRQPSVKPAKPPPNLAEGIESAFLNIEFSGIVESDAEQNDSDSEPSDDDSELDNVYVDIDGVPTQVKLEWLVWRRRYIATQGPTPATLDAFWRMIWQHRVHTIVMITNLVERGRRKCDMYWPGGGRGSSSEYGGVHVTLLHEDVRAAYTVRHMRVKSGNKAPPVDDGDKDSESSQTSDTAPDGSRTVVQYHYTVWPDHGTPRHPLCVLPFVKAAQADPGTVLVHCSAGVGRTGTYIVLDAQLNQLKLTGTLSPLGFLCRARTQRNHLVQTEEQYVFVHDALLEHVRSGETDVEFHKAREYLAKLLEPISEEELAVLDLNSKSKSVQDLTNGDNETTSVKSSPIECSEKEVVENGSQMSIKTDELNSEQSKSQSSARDLDGDESKEGMMNGDEGEGVYDLAPRSTDTYSKKMQAYNNMSEVEKEEMRRVNRAENFAVLERMRSLARRHHTYQGPPPATLLEKQFQLITRSCVEPSVCARAVHNADKNRPGGILPSDSARVMLVPKPGVEGSEYVNASWVCGRRRLREYAVAQHPSGGGHELWRLLWDHTAQLVLLLSDTSDPECEVFWPTEDERELYVANFRASFVSKDIYVAHRKSDQKTPAESPIEPETNGYRRQESDCADDERLIPDNISPIPETEPAYRFDRTELRLERLSGNRDLSTRKSIANGDLFSSLADKKNGPKSPKSPSKMSLKNFKLSSPTKFKFPDWGHRTAGSPPDTAPPPPPVAPSLSVEEEAELRRPCYRFEKVDSVPDSIPSDRIIEVTNVSVHSLQDDYQLSVKFIKCAGWLEGDTTEYEAGRPDDNEFVRAVRQAADESEREEALDRLTHPYRDSFALIEFVAGCQMEYKNGPVVVVDKYGGWKAMNFCTLSSACGGARDPHTYDPQAAFRQPCDSRASLYCSSALAAHARCGTEQRPHSLPALLAAYCALARYTALLAARR
ncbi:uncharacterized protein LOC106138033 isoform X2 [Amyelois transitella]|uniref:uncharacterized protein LOC106138033 isoform X2 n=1 Tax=Amyelois transitella TaxID=680683 RepID=UPI00298FCF40|nr:uncharacterized protein LOC106138033 isoform X2 [Amyelois transitella]